MFRVVTLAREYGSGGGSIAQLLAARLGWKLLDRCLVEKIAQAARVEPSVAQAYDERPDPWFDRLARAFWQGGGLRGALPGPSFDVFDANTVASLTQGLIEEAATMGNCVIVGRASQCILQRRSDTFHVFIYAPRKERLRLVRQRHASLAEAEEALDVRDRQRAAYVRRFYGQDWTNRHLYHLMLSSSQGEQVAVSTILTAIGLDRERLASLDRGDRHEG
jgi:cytidylate kinase